jgi:hypothetical protein
MNFWQDLRQPMAENNERETCKSASSDRSDGRRDLRDLPPLWCPPVD